MSLKKSLFFIFALFVFCFLFNGSQFSAGAEAKFTDIDSHWAATPITSMLNEGIVSGYPDNTFRPNQAISRAEFITIINKAYRFTSTTEISYSDVAKTDWFWAEISKASAEGYLSGYTDGSIKPGNTITRQEAAVLIARASKMAAGNVGEPAGFKDVADIPEWSRGALAALTSAGYLGGYPDGSIQPDRSLSRAEAVQIVSKVMTAELTQALLTENGMELDKAGYYGPVSGEKDISGNIIIRAAGVILQHVRVSGDLLITEAVGDGDVTLKNVSVKGTTYIKGGGTDTVTIDGCELGRTIIDKKDGDIRVFLTGQSIIAELQVDSPANVAGLGRILKAIINAKAAIESKPDALEIKSGITATIAGKTESGAPTNTGGSNANDSDGGSSGDSGSSGGYIMPEQVESLAVNQLFGMTFVTVKLKADLAPDVDEVYIMGNQAATQDGISYKKVLSGIVEKQMIFVTVKTISPEDQFSPSLIIPSGCSLEYVPGTDKSQVQVQTSMSAIVVSADDIPMREESPGLWQCELDGELVSVTIFANDGNNSEVYVLTNAK